MRSIRAILVVSALLAAGALAGCFGGEDDTGDDGTDTGAGGTDGGTDPGTGGGTDPGTGGGNTTTPPPTTRPRDVNETFTLTLAPGAGPTAGTVEHPFTVPAAGWRTFEVTVGVQPPASGAPGVFLADRVDINVLDPAGTVAGTATFSAGPAGAPQTITVATGTEGQWKVTAKAATAGVSATFSGTIVVTY